MNKVNAHVTEATQLSCGGDQMSWLFLLGKTIKGKAVFKFLHVQVPLFTSIYPNRLFSCSEVSAH